MDFGSGMSNTAEWHYVGHYGQLGPLTLDQMFELIEDGVVERDTFVWKAGFADWSPAEQILDFAGVLKVSSSPLPPPVPSARPSQFVPAMPVQPQPRMGGSIPTFAPSHYGMERSYIKSDKSRILAGLLQLLIPGVGRMYLGYAAHGSLQFILTPFGCGAGWLWSIVDGIIILCGGLKLDGYGRQLSD